MPFVAECTFCRLMLQGVPDRRLGSSVECPRCHSCFTLAPMSEVRAAARNPRIVVKKAEASETSAAVAAPLPAPSVLAVEERNEAKVVHPPLPQETELPVSGAGWSADASIGLASFLLGSLAWLTAAIFPSGLLTFLLGLPALLLGVAGCLLVWRRKRYPVLSAAGLLVGLTATLVAAFAPHVLGLSPLRSPQPFAVRGQPAVLALSGQGDLRPAAAGETLWADAGKDALHQGDVRLRVVAAMVGPVRFEPIHGRRPAAERGLVIRLRVTNAGITRALPYTGWGGEEMPEAPLLHDNQGKSYRLKSFSTDRVVVGRALKSSIPSGKSLEDVVVFEAPPPTVEWLRLELPAAAAGGAGMLRFEIPKHTIVFR